MPKNLSACLAALILAGCATTAEPVVAVYEPCPSEGLAPTRPEPVHPIPDPVEKGRVFGAIAAVIGEERAQALVRYWETEEPTWGRQGWERVSRVKIWCER